MSNPTHRIVTSQVGLATPAIEVPRGTTTVPVGLAPLESDESIGSVVVRAELALDGQDGAGFGTRQWFDAGETYDLSASATTLWVWIAGYSAFRFAIRTVAADGDPSVLGVWVGTPFVAD